MRISFSTFLLQSNKIPILLHIPFLLAIYVQKNINNFLYIELGNFNISSHLSIFFQSLHLLLKLIFSDHFYIHRIFSPFSLVLSIQFLRNIFGLGVSIYLFVKYIICHYDINLYLFNLFFAVYNYIFSLMFTFITNLFNISYNNI